MEGWGDSTRGDLLELGHPEHCKWPGPLPALVDNNRVYVLARVGHVTDSTYIC